MVIKTRRIKNTSGPWCSWWFPFLSTALRGEPFAGSRSAKNDRSADDVRIGFNDRRLLDLCGREEMSIRSFSCSKRPFSVEESSEALSISAK